MLKDYQTQYKKIDMNEKIGNNDNRVRIHEVFYSHNIVSEKKLIKHCQY